MTADFVTVCDAISADLVANVSGLATATIHLYAPWSPEELYAVQGERHLAVWPVAESADLRLDLSNDSHELTQNYDVLAWEDNTPAMGRLSEDATGDKAFLQLHNDVRARFYVTANQNLGGSDLVWYQGATFVQGSGTMRWFRIIVNVRRIQPFT